MLCRAHRLICFFQYVLSPILLPYYTILDKIHLKFLLRKLYVKVMVPVLSLTAAILLVCRQ